MSDTVKLIIEIPKETYKKITADKYAIYDKMYYSIKNGTPLDDVKARIIDNAFKNANETGFIFIGRLWRIFDNIGKAESKDPNDMTRMFEGVTEIPKDAFKGWYTEKMLEQTREESEDK